MLVIVGFLAVSFVAVIGFLLASSRPAKPTKSNAPYQYPMRDDWIDIHAER